MSKIGMGDVVELIRNSTDTAQLIFNPDLLEYLTELDEIGSKILKEIPDDQLVASITLLQALIAADLLNDGEMKLAFMCLADPTVFGGMMAVALKMSVGLAALEEWR